MRVNAVPLGIVLGVLFAFGIGARAQAADSDLAAVADSLIERGAETISAYDPEDGMTTSDAFSDLYFDLFEGRGLEAAIGRRDGDRKGDLESRFSKIIGLSAQGAPALRVAAAWGDLRKGLEEERDLFSVKEEGGWAASFTQSFLILLREGVEALLVVGALIAYVQRVGARDTLPVLYGGIGTALVASGVTAWGVRASVMGLDGRALEAVEGVTLLLAAAVLLYVGHWLFSKREAARWQGYIKEKVERAAASGSGFTLAFAAFLAVYREGAETVLFYQALLADGSTDSGAVASGFLVAAMALVTLFVAVRWLGLRLPLRPFFTGTAALLVLLAFVFVGKGIVELQVIRWVSATPLDGGPSLAWLGLFPTVESLAAQALFLMIVIGGTAIPIFRRARA